MQKNIIETIKAKSLHELRTQFRELIKEISSGLLNAADYGEELELLSSRIKKLEAVSKKEINTFLKDWGQSEHEICSCLGYEPEDEGVSEMLMGDGYFWLASKELWCNVSASGFTDKDQHIADSLRYGLIKV